MLENLKPERVFYYFENLCKIPHGSHDTKRISDYLCFFALKNNLEHHQDQSGNVVIRKPASAGKYRAKGVILQAHIDMVCEKDDNVSFDFSKDPLDIFVEGDFVKAKGTTLGGDDGIGAAIMLAILEDQTLKHGPLTAVFTVDEEVGMLGAIALNKSGIEGEYLLNLDSEEENHFLTSCAGGVTLTVRMPIERVEKEGNVYEITLSGLTGGHSGTMIQNNSANAIKVIHDVAQHMKSEFDFYGINVEGGLKDNAIPRSAVVTILADVTEDKLAKCIEKCEASLKKIWKDTDPDLTLAYKFLGKKTASVISRRGSHVNYFLNVPNGVQSMSSSVEGLVETSLNAGILKTYENEMVVVHSIRSSIKEVKENLLKKVISIADKFNAKTEISGEYPAWEYRQKSHLRKAISKIYKKQKKEPIFEGIHAGLECGVFYEANPKLDIVSFGPDIFDIHTPRERLSISSTERCYDFTVKLLEELC